MESTMAQTTGKDADVQEMIDAFEERGVVYSLLSRLYAREVDQETLDDLCETLYPAEDEDCLSAEGYRLIATYLSNIWDESVTELSVDYANCFLGKGVDSFTAAYLNESVYTSEKRLLMQEARVEVLAAYRSAGFVKAEEWHDGEDHIALELDFMRVLNNQAIDALKQGNERKAVRIVKKQLEFLQRHLVSWVPMMTADLKKFARTDLYRGLAFLTEGFLWSDRAFLAGLLS
ncbi:MAG: molecular chaperone TorD family protein [Eggerthellaceae bacterium]|nr:molecular chaperone TorD family protein [Eggerthellaceae bacterium]